MIQIFKYLFIIFELPCFNLTEDEKDQEENASLGVYWLIKASSQGHKEATQLLKECLDTGKGLFIIWLS